MIAAKARVTKLCGLVLALNLASFGLAGCAAVPFGVPQGRPGYPIVTSGVFRLPDGAALPYRLYPAAGTPRVVVLALHGFSDSRDAWAMLAQVLNPQGIALYAPDQSSSGATANRGRWPGTATLVNEARDMAVLLRQRYPDTKLVVMGESMGSAVAILLGASPKPPPVDAYVISAPAVWGGAALNPFYRTILAMADDVSPGSRLTGSVADVKASDNRAALIAYSEDPLTIHSSRIDAVEGLVQLMGAAQAACANFRQPALILYGGHDELVPASAIKDCWNAIPAGAPVILAFYPPDYHLIERDNERAVPDADIAGYILGSGIMSSAPSLATVFLVGPESENMARGD